MRHISTVVSIKGFCGEEDTLALGSLRTFSLSRLVCHNPRMDRFHPLNMTAGIVL
ncbi:MAG: hypothetical protein ACFC1C_02870 [Candidatus Malihini olakiniferum]